MLSNKQRKWIRGGLEILIHGGTSAIIAGMVGVQQNGGWIFASPDFWKMVSAQFIGNGLLRFFQYFAANPLPPEETDSPIPVEKQVISMNPLNKVQSVPSEPPKGP